MKQETIISILLSIVVFLIIVLVLVFIFNKVGEDMSITYNKCCNGQPCTDTFWDAQQEKCIYTMQPSAPFYYFNWWTIPIVLVFALILLIVVRFVEPSMGGEE